MSRARRIGLGASFALFALFAFAALPASARAQDDLGEPEPAPVRRGARGSRFLFSPSVGWLHSQAYGVPLDMVDAQLGLGASLAQDESGFGADLAGLLAFQGGETQAGRRLSGIDFLGAEVVVHYHWLRAGLGGRIGTLAVQRATRDATESSLNVDGYVSLGVEPFAIAGQPFFVEARLHGMDWAGPASALWIGAGFRLCGGGGCVR